jgi:hypothetical protein
MKTKKTGNPANTIKYVLAGIGVIFLAVVISVLTFHEPTQLADNTTETDHELHESTTVIVSPGHPTNEQEFEAMKENPPEGTNFAIIEDLPSAATIPGGNK